MRTETFTHFGVGDVDVGVDVDVVGVGVGTTHNFSLARYVARIEITVLYMFFSPGWHCYMPLQHGNCRGRTKMDILWHR